MGPVRGTDVTAGLRPAGRQDAGAPGGVRSAGILPAPTGAEGDVKWRSRGYLPHIDMPNLVQHVIIRLADSLPIEARQALDKARPADRVAVVDAALDRGHGRRDLADPIIAELVQNALLTLDGERYALLAWCVMPNHIHVLVEVRSGYRLERIVHSWKSYTAIAANRLLGRTGAFWAREYFDRFMRDAEHLVRTAAYIEGNPVKAGLCQNVADWRCSSAWRGWGGGAGLRPACRQDAGAPEARD
jgi:putative transposase